ncbi:MAG: helix-turn-helix transcriptional regulator [Proteobacteria bacterium]|nr:helix-turn-helix transcriptional regulator [Pseudomonadota bacterium]
MRRASPATYDTLLAGIYDAALDSTLWPAVLDAAANSFGASKAIVYTPDMRPQDGGFFHVHNIPIEAVERYSAHYQHLDLWTLGHHARYGGQAGGFLGDMFIATRDLERSEFYADHLRPQDMHKLCTAVTLVGPTKGSYVSFAMFRGRNAKEFTEHERRLGEHIAPHIQRALLIAARLHSAQRVGRVDKEMLDVASAAIFLVDASGTLLKYTPAAERLLQEGTYLRARANRLQAATGSELLRDVIGEVSKSAAGRPYSRILPLGHTRGAGRVHVLVVGGGMHNPKCAFVVVGAVSARPLDFAQRLAQVYRLTPAETRLCELLHQGRTIEEASEFLKVKRSTVLSQLKSIFFKTDLNRQSALTRLLIDLAAL